MKAKIFDIFHFFFFQAEDGIRDKLVTGVQTCALPISAVLLPLWLRRTHWRNALWAAALAAACAWPYRSAWPQVLDSLAYYESHWRNNNASLYALLAWFSGSTDLAAGAGVGVVAGLAVWAAARRMD